jgi:hypothetical protein
MVEDPSHRDRENVRDFLGIEQALGVFHVT